MFNGKNLVILLLLLMVLFTCPSYAAPNAQDLPGVPLSRVKEPLSNLKKTENSETAAKMAVSVLDIKKKVAKNRRVSREKKEEPSSVLLSLLPGENLVIPIAIKHPNRILTPYDNAKVFTTRVDEIQTDGGIVYVTPSKDGPLTMFITDRDGDQSVSLSVTLVPSPIPPREIKLVFGSLAGAGMATGLINGNKTEARKFERRNNHYDRINSVMLALAKQEIPSGYSLRTPGPQDSAVICDIPGTVIRTGQLLDGYSLSASISVLTNITSQPIQIRESSCWQQGVLGVATWPSVEFLQPNTSVELYVLHDKTQEVKTNIKTRPGLLSQLSGGVDK